MHHCIIIGAGLLGLATAWSLSRRGVRTLVLDTGPPGHARSGSKGTARIFRLGYPDPLYVEMAIVAEELWRTVEGATGTALLHTTGQVTFGPDIAAVGDAMAAVGAPFEMLAPAEARQRAPHLAVPGPAIWEARSGVLVADACLDALRRDSGATVHESAPVQSIHQDDGTVTVTTVGGSVLRADTVVNCAGPDALALMGGVQCPVARPPTLQQVVYLAVEGNPHQFPVFIEWGDDMIYGLPVIGQHLCKLAQHTSGPEIGTDVDQSDDPALLATLTDAARRLLPGLDATPVATERCLYDNTSDTDFIIDRVGRIVIGCGTSGHGFKFGPLFGEVLADLVTGAEPCVDISRFSLSRPDTSITP